MPSRSSPNISLMPTNSSCSGVYACLHFGQRRRTRRCAKNARTALDTMFHKFRVIKSHLIPIEQNDKIIGIVTAEDLIEETLGHEIADETDHSLKRG